MKAQIQEILKKYSIHFDRLDILKDLTTNLQQANESEVVLYRLKSEDQTEIDLFKRRLSKSNSKLVIVNSKIANVEENVFAIKADLFERFKIELIEAFYPLPKKMPKCIGVTGTNGKTTTVQLITSLLEQNGCKAISVGTIGVCDHSGKVIMPTEMTTPGYETIRKIFHHYSSVDYIVFEVSSHALEQDRLNGIKLEVAGWTNFTQDHLDYHQTMENYFQSKKKIIEITRDKRVVFPSTQIHLCEKLREGEFCIAKKIPSHEVANFPDYLKVDFNLDNLELAITLVEQVLLSPCQYDPQKLKMPAGRIESVPRKNGFVFIDYAHTPDALERVLKSLKSSFPSKPLWAVFGCGGNRDKGKRPLMGAVANKIADEFIVTSDNPRDEDPQQIIDEILANLSRGFGIVDRAMAIKNALEHAPQNAIILIAGKGHESYQEIKGVKTYFNDKEMVMKLMENTNAN